MIGADVRHFRKEILGMTQETLANRIGVTTKTISNWECSKEPLEKKVYYILTGVLVETMKEAVSFLKEYKKRVGK